MDKILRINMGAAGGPKATVTQWDLCRSGRRAMTSGIVSRKCPLCVTLSARTTNLSLPRAAERNNGSDVGQAFGGLQEPLTGGIKEANAGGQPSQMLARLGYAAIVLEGKPRRDLFTKYSSTRTG